MQSFACPICGAPGIWLSYFRAFCSLEHLDRYAAEHVPPDYRRTRKPVPGAPPWRPGPDQDVV